MGRKIASLDIGSNSTLCLIVEERTPGSFSVVADEARITGLGRGLSAAGLRPEARARCLEALTEYRTLLNRYEVREVYAAATAAMRDAVDGDRFAREIRDQVHIPVEIISGEREAELTWLAVARGFGRTHPIAVLDIGGRSTELMQGEGPRLGARVSLPLGSVSGTETFLSGDPVSPESVDSFRAHVRETLQRAPVHQRVAELFGVAATVSTYAAMAFQMPTPLPAQIHGAVLTRHILEDLMARLIALPVARRTELIGLDARRAHVIVAGGLILVESLDHVGVDRLTVSDFGLRHGLFFEAHPEASLDSDT